MTLYVWGLVLLAMILYGFGDYCSKIYSNAGGNWLAILAIALYSIVSVVWLIALKEYNSLSVLGTIWSVFYAVVTVGLAILVFHEPLTARQMIGIFFGIVSIYFMSS